MWEYFWILELREPSWELLHISPNSSAVGVLAVLLFNVPEIFKIWPADPAGGHRRPPAAATARPPSPRGGWGIGGGGVGIRG